MNRKQPLVSTVSNKATLRNEGFLSKLSSTLVGRVAPQQVETQTTLKWHKTSDVKERIKTSTGTFAVYADTSEEEIQKIKETVALVPALGEEEAIPDVVSTVIAEAVNIATKSFVESVNEPKTSAVYVAIDYHTPDDGDGLPLIAGQKVILIDSSSPFKKAKLDNTDDEIQLLDNSAAKHKMAIRPKKHHPDPRSRAHEVPEIQEERWLVKEFDSDKEGYVPSRLLEAIPPSTAFAASLKRSLQEMSPEDTKEVKRKLTKEMKEIKSTKIRKSGSKVLGPTPEDEARAKRTATIRELIETEEEFVKDLQYVMENYYAKFDDPSTPKNIADQKESIFSNFKEIAEFHKNVLIEGVKFNAEIPKLIGKTFLRLERDFDKHSEYCCNEPLSEEFLDSNPDVRDYFEEFSQKIGDDKQLEDHLKLPIQRLNDYQLLLKELVKFSSRLGDDTTELERAHELMQTIPQRATDAKFIASIEGFKGNLYKLGRLIRHDWFTVTEVGHKPRDRYLFLFKARILITKVKRIGEDRSIFVLKDIIRLPETSLKGLDRLKVLEFLHIEPQSHPNFPIVLEARSQDIRDDWLTIVQEHVVDTASVEDLLFDDEIRVVSEEGEEEDRGQASPVGEVNDISEELPEDKVEELDQVVPATLELIEDLPKDSEELAEKESSPVHINAVNVWENAELSPPPEKESVVEVSPKRTKEEDELDFWSTKESSPPLKKRAVEPLEPDTTTTKDNSGVGKDLEKEYNQPLVTEEVPSHKEDELVTSAVAEEVKGSYLEQVETPAFKAEEKVAESKEEITHKFSEEIEQDLPVEETKVQGKQLHKESRSKLDSPTPIELPAEPESKPLKPQELIEDTVAKKVKESKVTEDLEKLDSVKVSKPSTVSEPPKVSKTPKSQETPKVVEPSKVTTSSKVPEKSKVQEIPKEPEIPKTPEIPKVPELPKVKEQPKISEPSEVSALSKLTKPPKVQEKKTQDTFEEKKPLKEKVQQKEIESPIDQVLTESKLVETKSSKKSLHKKVEEHKIELTDTIFGKTATLKEEDISKPIKDISSHRESPEKNIAQEKMSKTPGTPGTGGPRPIFTKTLAGDVVEPGESATFVCEVAHPISYYVTWLKDNKPLEDKLADRLKQIDDGTTHSLKLMHCRKEDSGIYTAKATDTSGASATCSAQLLVQELTEEERNARMKEKKPFFLVKMRDVEVIENTNLSYAVKVKGAPMPDVTFMKGNQPLKEDDRVKIHSDPKQGKYEISISHVSKEDAGKYKCIAKNKYDKTECEAEITVAEELEILQKLSGKGSLLKTGEKADFTWFRDGVEFDPVERFNVMFKDEEDTLALVFQNVTPDDAGIYTCVASTSCGKISCSAELTVEGSIHRLMKDPEPPKFTKALHDTHATITGTGMLECIIAGYPKPELTWYHEGKKVELTERVKQLYQVEVPDAVNLVIKDVDQKDEGTYKVVAKNDLGEASCICKLTIKYPPKFVDIPKIVGCSVGETLTYTVQVDGTPRPEITWMKDGKEVVPSDRVKFEKTSDGKFTLKIKDLKREECGPYSIQAINDMGLRTETFEVMENIKPEITEGIAAETEKIHKNDHVYEVKANGYPMPTATWYFNGKEIENDDKFAMAADKNTYTLKVKNLTRLDKGQYKIVLHNNTGTAQSEGVLKVRAPPFFTGPLDDACAKEGSKDIKMPVEWDSNPTPSVKWIFKSKMTGKETVVTEQSEGYSIITTEKTSILVIHKAVEEVVGVYFCTTTNEYGNASCNARFRLHEPPQVLEPLKDVEFLEDTTCTFSCRVSGVPIPDIKWMKNDVKWTPDETRVVNRKDEEEVYTLVFDTAKTEDTAKYVAIVSNVEGQVTTEGSILVNTPPHILSSNFKDGITFIAMHKFVLEVEATAVPEAEATWFCLGKQLKEEEDSVKFSFDGKVYRMERIGSDPEQSGEYKCKLKNKIKEVEEVGIVTIIEKESRVRQALKDLDVKEYTDGTIQCQIVGDPMPDVQWFRNGKPLTAGGKIEIREDRSKGLHTLVFKNVEEEDKSTFTIRGKNAHGTCETTCLMSILVAPRPGEFNDTVVDYGSDLLLQVHCHAILPPEVVWFQNDKRLEESDRVKYIRDEKSEIYSLKVTFAVLEDNGNYSYKATNIAGELTQKCVVKVHTVVPSVVEPLESVAKCLEDEITFYIRCAGLPLPEIEWRNKQAIVNKADRYTVGRPQPDYYCITLVDIKEEDYGTIKACARSLVGEAISTAELTQKKLGCEVIEGLDNVTYGAETDDVTLSVKIRGSPRPKYVWTKDGDVVKDDGMKYIINFTKTNYCEGILSLTIQDGAAGDSGQYRLRFFNDVDEAHSETALVVRPMRCAPKISRPPGDLHVIETEPGMFKGRVTGFPKPVVKWYKDGREIRQTDVLGTGVTSDKCYYIDFKSIAMEDAGKYTLVATNDEGETECEVNLSVDPRSAKPEFLHGLKATKVINGYPCRMEVKLDGHPAPKVAWLKDGKPLEFDGKHIREIVTDDGRVILQIDNATDADKGEYSVVASNDQGQNASSAPLSVLDHERRDGQPDGPAEFKEGLKDSCFDEGQTIRLPVTVKGGPVPDMKWYKDGKEIKLDDRCFFTYDGDKTYLEIYPCLGVDAGKYKCVIENENGKSETECDVSIRKCFETPSFGYGFPNQQQVPGGDAKFSIKVDGVPRPEISWYVNGKLIEPDGEKYRVRKDADGCTLFVRGVTYDDSGVYKCVAKNREGQAEHQGSLQVSDDIDPNMKFEPPVILKAIGDQELYEDFTARFKALVTGRPLPDFEWYKNGNRIYHTDRQIIERDSEGIIRLTIKHVYAEDAGVYELKVWNEHGQASCKGKLICECISKHKKRPVGNEYMGYDKISSTGITIPIPDQPYISALSDRRVTLSWMPYLPSNPMPPVTYQIEMCDLPEGDWYTAKSGIKGCSVDIENLGPKTDYKFRVRVENKFGVSEPSPYVATHRGKLERDRIVGEPTLEGPTDISVDGPYVPPGFRINRDEFGNFSAAPRFMKLPNETQYGMKHFNARVKWVAFGYPTPKVKLYFKDDEVKFGRGSKYTFSQEASGEITLFVDRLDEDDVGWYKCVVSNEYGESQQRIRLALCEYPKVTQHLQETWIRGQTAGKIFCRISGYPPCDVKWFKDWQEIKPCMKTRPHFLEPDMYCLDFHGPALKDSGLYSLAAVNVAGAASSSCMVHVEDDELTFNWHGHGRGKHIDINVRRGTLEDHYDIGDELGRGTQGVTYHCVEHHTGRNFAAKSMWGKDQFKEWMHMEYEMMNLVNACRRIVRLYDVYESPKNMVLVTELCAGGDLLSALTKKNHITEYEVAHYIRQVLEGLDYMHDRFMAHLGLNIGDLMVSHANGQYIKIGDLSLARNIREYKLQPLEYGMPEFVAPEVAKGENVSYPADMWAVGVITYILLSGTSPFRGEHDRETLTRIQKGELRFDADAFSNLSEEAKDFVAKLLQFKPENRMDVKSALNHPWMSFCDMCPRDPYKINTDRLGTYQLKFKEWYANASCKRWYRRRPLASAFTHPSKMVYPPGEIYTPEETPERDLMPVENDDYSIPYRDLSYEIEPFSSDSRYQQGPDTFLLQLRDADFPARLRHYMNIAKERSPSYAISYKDKSYDYEVDDSDVRRSRVRTEYKPTQFVVPADDTDWDSLSLMIPYGRRGYPTVSEAVMRRREAQSQSKEVYGQTFSTYATKETYESSVTSKKERDRFSSSVNRSQQ